MGNTAVTVRCHAAGHVQSSCQCLDCNISFRASQYSHWAHVQICNSCVWSLVAGHCSALQCRWLAATPSSAAAVSGCVVQFL